MLAKEHPGLADVILTLLKGNLFSNGIGLISHWGLMYGYRYLVLLLVLIDGNGVLMPCGVRLLA